MLDPRPTGEVAGHWQGFMSSLRKLLSFPPRHRHQDQFLRVKESALMLGDTEKMATEVEAAYRKLARTNRQKSSKDVPENDFADIVIEELEAFQLAVDVQEKEAEAGRAKGGASRHLMKTGKTILGSVTNVFSLSSYGKGVITVLGEVLDLFSD